jgi:hypothetical protein
MSKKRFYFEHWNVFIYNSNVHWFELTPGRRRSSNTKKQQLEHIPVTRTILALEVQSQLLTPLFVFLAALQSHDFRAAIIFVQIVDLTQIFWKILNSPPQEYDIQGRRIQEGLDDEPALGCLLKSLCRSNTFRLHVNPSRRSWSRSTRNLMVCGSLL